jgi:hypothetical protein
MNWVDLNHLFKIKINDLDLNFKKKFYNEHYEVESVITLQKSLKTAMIPRTSDINDTYQTFLPMIWLEKCL